MEEQTGRDPRQRAREILEAVEQTFRTGTVPEKPPVMPDPAVQEQLNAILSDIASTQQFARSLARGDLSQELGVSGHTAGCLKALQANLRHLTWQARQIADGDLSQRVVFMGEFADSFNAMARHLEDVEIQRSRREEELRTLNADLAREITERKRTEDALRQANRKITMLSSITRHDIRNQLLALQGYLELSAKVTSDPALLSYIEKEILAAGAIANQVEFTKYYESIGVKAPEWQDIPLLIQSARSQLNLPDTLRCEIDLLPVKVFADSLIGKVFYNLFENTLRHGQGVSRIRLSFRETENGAEIVYEDNGIGISLSDKQHLFQKGFGKNTGLGLFLSQEILAITGLTIHEEGEPGKGVRFVISIPDGTYRLSQEQ